MLAVLLLFLLLPIIQDLTNVKTYIDPLKGTFSPEPDTSIGVVSWFDGGYQHQKEKFLRDNFGLHHYYIRLNSQFKFSLFKKANAVYVIVGNENHLFESNYINTFYGRDFVGGEKINEWVRKLRCVQDTLKKQNKLLVVVLAPGKASFFPEHIPEHMRGSPAVTNYLYLRESLKHNGVNHIDFNRHFVKEKYKSKYPLYPQYGIHWSNYGSIMAFDSLTKFVEAKLQADLPELDIVRINVSDSLQHTDNDISEGMNLFWISPTAKMAYPKYYVREDSSRHKKPRALTVADSFWWYIYSTNIPAATYSNHEFWFYNQAIYPQSFSAPLYVSETDYFSRIRSYDVFFILHTEATLDRFGSGFIEMLYETFCERSENKEKVQAIKAAIHASKDWRDSVFKKSVEKNISLDSAIVLEAYETISKNAGK